METKLNYYYETKDKERGIITLNNMQFAGFFTIPIEQPESKFHHVNEGKLAFNRHGLAIDMQIPAATRGFDNIEEMIEWIREELEKVNNKTDKEQIMYYDTLQTLNLKPGQKIRVRMKNYGAYKGELVDYDIEVDKVNESGVWARSFKVAGRADEYDGKNGLFCLKDIVSVELD